MSKLWGIILSVLAGMAVFFGALLKAFNAGKKEQKLEVIEKEEELKEEIAEEVVKVKKESKKKTDENIKKSSKGDWSGFNRRAKKKDE